MNAEKTYPNVLKPGCQGCIRPDRWQHDEDCPGRAAAAGHRHAKDFVGRSLYIGDTVAITFQRGGKGSKWVLLRADVVNITPKGVRVVTEDEGYELVREECQVMKVRQP